MKTLKKGDKYSLVEVKENYLIIKKGIVYFAISEESISEKNIYSVFESYDQNQSFMQTLMEIYDNL